MGYSNDGDRTVIHLKTEHFILVAFPDFGHGDAFRGTQYLGGNSLQLVEVKFPIAFL